MSHDDYRYYEVPQDRSRYCQGSRPGYPPAGYYYGTGQPPAPRSVLGGWFDFRNPNYLKGALIAAGVTLLVANPKVQKTLLTGLAKAWSGLQYGVEEVKEQINDIRAEMRFKQEQKSAQEEESGDA